MIIMGNKFFTNYISFDSQDDLLGLWIHLKFNTLGAASLNLMSQILPLSKLLSGFWGPIKLSSSVH